MKYISDARYHECQMNVKDGWSHLALSAWCSARTIPNCLGKLLSIEDSILKSDKQGILKCLFLFLHECGNVSQKFLLTFWVYVSSYNIIQARVRFYYCFCEFSAVTVVRAKS